MPADTFVLIFKCVARPNFCDPPRLHKAATTLAASGGQRSGKKSKFETNKKE